MPWGRPSAHSVALPHGCWVTTPSPAEGSGHTRHPPRGRQGRKAPSLEAACVRAEPSAYFLQGLPGFTGCLETNVSSSVLF